MEFILKIFLGGNVFWITNFNSAVSWMGKNILNEAVTSFEVNFKKKSWLRVFLNELQA